MRIHIYELVDNETKRKLKATVHRPKPVKKYKEKKSRRYWEDLMGTRRDTYRRENGRVKRK